MMFAQYCRIETKAGGISATNRAFVRAAHSLLSNRGKSQQMRLMRHRWLREGLHLHNLPPVG